VRLASLALLGLIAASISGAAFAQDAASLAMGLPARPTIGMNRWQEDWSVLADPSLRTEPFDNLKYIPLSPDDPKSYVSLGLTLRERFESLNAATFGVGGIPIQNYVLDREYIHADIRPNQNWQIFIQLQNDYAPGKSIITPVDRDPLDLAQGFVAYTGGLADGEVKARMGRQEMAFDLQRFVSIRDGPNVRQAYDAAWLDWEKDPWRVISFWSHPVIYINRGVFNDYSNGQFQFGGFRLERRDVGPGHLSAYYSRYDLDNSHFLFASGRERRNNFDVHYAGDYGGWDWDLETMVQTGSVGAKTARAWALGTIDGFTFADANWRPRLGLQVDAASGDRNPGASTLGTFNPLFPNGYYFTLAGFTTYANMIHVKPSVTVKPTSTLTFFAAAALQWRETTADAVYVIPNIPVPGTAGSVGHWTGAYGQIRADYAFSDHLTGAIEAVYFGVGSAIRRAGGHDSDYIGVELDFGW
jgi:Alginate export